MRPPFRAARTPVAEENGRDAASSSITAPYPQSEFRQSVRFRQLTERVHRLGPRPLGELLLEVAAGRDLLEALEDYAGLDPTAVARLNARDWPPSMWAVSA